jgi:hypothetical protein
MVFQGMVSSIPGVLSASGDWATLAALTDKMVWIQIYGYLKEGMDPMSEWKYSSRIYTMVCGPAKFFWHFPKMAKTGQRATALNRWFGLVLATIRYLKLTK